MDDNNNLKSSDKRSAEFDYEREYDGWGSHKLREVADMRKQKVRIIIVSILLGLGFLLLIIGYVSQRKYPVSELAEVPQDTTQEEVIAHVENAPKMIEANEQAKPEIQQDSVKQEMTVPDKPEIQQDSVKQEMSVPEKKGLEKPILDENGKPLNLTKKEVVTTLRSAGSQFRTCSRTSPIKGTLKVSFMIGEDGNIRNAKVVTPEFKDTPTASCVMKVLNTIHFKAPGGSIPVNNYPIQIQ